MLQFFKVVGALLAVCVLLPTFLWLIMEYYKFFLVFAGILVVFAPTASFFAWSFRK